MCRLQRKPVPPSAESIPGATSTMLDRPSGQTLPTHSQIAVRDQVSESILRPRGANMKQGSLKAVLLAAGLLVAAAVPALSQTGEIRGTVRAADTGAAVSGAVVQAVSGAGLVAR